MCCDNSIGSEQVALLGIVQLVCLPQKATSNLTPMYSAALLLLL